MDIVITLKALKPGNWLLYKEIIDFLLLTVHDYHVIVYALLIE
jgi:hypothetical protein